MIPNREGRVLVVAGGLAGNVRAAIAVARALEGRNLGAVVAHPDGPTAGLTELVLDAAHHLIEQPTVGRYRYAPDSRSYFGDRPMLDNRKAKARHGRKRRTA